MNSDFNTMFYEVIKKIKEISEENFFLVVIPPA